MGLRVCGFVLFNQGGIFTGSRVKQFHETRMTLGAYMTVSGNADDADSLRGCTRILFFSSVKLITVGEGLCARPKTSAWVVTRRHPGGHIGEGTEEVPYKKSFVTHVGSLTPRLSFDDFLCSRFDFLGLCRHSCPRHIHEAKYGISRGRFRTDSPPHYKSVTIFMTFAVNMVRAACMIMPSRPYDFALA